MNTNTTNHLVILDFDNTPNITEETFFDVLIPPFHNRHPFIRYVYNDFNRLRDTKYGFTFTTQSLHPPLPEYHFMLFDIHTIFAPAISEIWLVDQDIDEAVSLSFCSSLSDEHNDQGIFVKTYLNRHLNTVIGTPANLFNLYRQFSETLPSNTYLHKFTPSYYLNRLNQLQQDQDEVPL